MVLSVIIPVYNGEKYIGRCLSSLLRQSCKDFEAIVVDDGSTDNTLAVVDDILKGSDFKQVKIIRMAHIGVSFARNEGIKAAQGEYIMFLDADDVIKEDLVERVAYVASKYKPELICWKICETFKCDETSCTGLRFEGLQPYEVQPTENLLKSWLIERRFYFWTSSFCVRRDIVESEKLRFLGDLKFSEDFEFEIRVLLSAKKFFYLDEVLALYCRTSSSVSFGLFSESQFDHLKAREYALSVVKQKLPQSTLREQVVNALRSSQKTRFLGASLEAILYKGISVNVYFQRFVKVNSTALEVFRMVRRNPKLSQSFGIKARFLLFFFSLSPKIFLNLFKIVYKLVCFVSKFLGKNFEIERFPCKYSLRKAVPNLKEGLT